MRCTNRLVGGGSGSVHFCEVGIDVLGPVEWHRHLICGPSSAGCSFAFVSLMVSSLFAFIFAGLSGVVILTIPSVALVL